MTAAGVCLRTVNGELQVLLVRSGAGRWIFPKGTVQGHETPLRAAERETREEAGWRTVPWAPGSGIRVGQLGEYETTSGPATAFVLVAKEQESAGEPGRCPRWFSIGAARSVLCLDHPGQAEGLLAVLEEAVRRLS